jgi:hypothetical protein
MERVSLPVPSAKETERFGSWVQQAAGQCPPNDPNGGCHNAQVTAFYSTELAVDEVELGFIIPESY